MARASFRVTKLATTGVDDFHFTNSGGQADALTSSAAVKAGQATVTAAITAALGAAGGSHDSTTEITTVQTDWVAQVALENAVTSTGDVVVSIDTSKITSVTLLRKALDHVVQQAMGGVGGLTLS